MTVRDLIDELSKQPPYMRVITQTRSLRKALAEEVRLEQIGGGIRSENVVAIIVERIE